MSIDVDTAAPTALAAATDNLRSADLATLAAALDDQRTRSVDVVTPGKSIRFDGAQMVLEGLPLLDAEITADGVTPGVDPNGRYTATATADAGMSGRLDIPLGYLRRMRSLTPALYAENLNTWLGMSGGKFLLRTLKGTDGGVDVLRAFLSDRYRPIDYFDVLLATLKGITGAGIENPIITADLTERRMIVRVEVPEVNALAPSLLAGYRSPFSGNTGTDNPMVWAGFVVTDSETGCGKFSIMPRVVVQACKNGVTFAADSLDKVHLGGRLDEGVIKWSEQTAANNLALVASQTTDAVRTFISPEYLQAKIDELDAVAGVKVDDVPVVLAGVAKRLGFSADEAKLIMGHFIDGGQRTAGGVLQAVTSAAQLIHDGDAALNLELQAITAMHAAAELASK